VKIGQAEQQLEQARTLVGGRCSVPGKQYDGEIALLTEPMNRAGVRRLPLLAALLNCGNARKDLIQVMGEAHALTMERNRNRRRASADTADASLCQYGHTYPSARNSNFGEEHAHNQFSHCGFL